MAPETGCEQKLTISCIDYFNEKFSALQQQLALRDETQNERVSLTTDPAGRYIRIQRGF
jgi:hypothetical protein